MLFRLKHTLHSCRIHRMMTSGWRVGTVAAGLHSTSKCHVRLLSLKVVPLGGNLDAGGGKLVTLVLQGKRGLNDGVWRRSPPRVRRFQFRLPRWGPVSSARIRAPLRTGRPLREQESFSRSLSPPIPICLTSLTVETLQFIEKRNSLHSS